MSKGPCFPIMIVAAALAACASKPQQQTDNNPGIAAFIGDRAITVKELDDRWRATQPALHAEAVQALFNGRRAALTDLLASALIENAATAKRMRVDDFANAEISRRMTPVAGTEITAFYQQNVKQMQGRPLEQMAPAISEYLTEERRTRARQTLVAELRKTGPAVRLMLEAPRHAVSVSPSDPALGSTSAPVTIVEFSDFQCPFCRLIEPTLARIRDVYGNSVRVVWKDFPLARIHPQALKAAEAAHCAGEQGRYWGYHDRLFERQGAAQASDLTRYALDLGLDRARFSQCMESSRYAGRVRSSIDEGTQLGVASTPTLYINGRPLSGAQPFDAIASIIDEELSRN